MRIKKFALNAVLTIAAVMLLGTKGVDAEEVTKDGFVINNIVCEDSIVPVADAAVENPVVEMAPMAAPVVPVVSAVPEMTEVPLVTEAPVTEDVSVEKDKAVKKKVEKKAKTAKRTVNKKRFTKAELRLMSAIIYCEAGNESYAGKLAVGIVIMNRKESKAFANSVKGVIYQRGQFPPARNGILSRALAKYDAGRFTSSAQKQCIRAAKEALSGEKYVSYKGKDKNFKSFKFFNTYLSGARFKIGCHMFK